MSLLATAADYMPANPEEAATALYSSGYAPGYDSRIPVRAAWVETQAAPAEKIAVWGCCWGYFVSLLVADGYDAYGFDGSAWAIGVGRALYPGIASRLFVRDVTVSDDVAASTSDAGGSFGFLITDDLFPCCSDGEIVAALPNLRATTTRIAHGMTPLDLTATQDARLNWKSMSDWRALVAPDVAYDAATNRVA